MDIKEEKERIRLKIYDAEKILRGLSVSLDQIGFDSEACTLKDIRHNLDSIGEQLAAKGE